MQRRGAQHLSTTLAATLLTARARGALQIRNEHESARTACAPLSVLKLFCYVNAFVDRLPSGLGLGRLGLHEVDRLAGHDGRDRMLIHELRMTVPPQENTKVVEPAHDPLKLDAIDEENGQRRLVLAHVVQERVLKVLDSICAHFCYPPVLGSA
jgi:hypothetical protein